MKLILSILHQMVQLNTLSVSVTSNEVYAQSESIEQILIGFILLYRNLHNIFI